MKKLLISTIAGIALATVQMAAQTNAQQQQARRAPVARTGARETTTENKSTLTVRAQDLNERMTQEIGGNTRWMRVVYRELDLNNEQNAPLYYPPRPVNGQMNLFSTMFNLFVEGKVQAYRYEDGYEAFDDEHKLNLKEFLDGAHIYYEEVAQRGADTTFVINESDVPSAEVLTYYVKEAWYFNQDNSLFDVKTLAICPLVTVAGDLSATETTPLFWMPYEEIRPYLADKSIMTSDVNNAKTFTVDDYLRRRMFKGEIIKTENLMNKTMRQLYPDPDTLRLAQQAVDKQITDFHESLYVKPDSTQLDPKAAKKAEKEREKAAKAAAKDSGSTVKAPKQEKVKAPKAETAPVRSVRRR